MTRRDSIGMTIVRRDVRSLSRRAVAVTALVSALAALLPAGGLSAAEITYTSVTGIWHDAVDNLPGSPLEKASGKGGKISHSKIAPATSGSEYRQHRKP